MANIIKELAESTLGRKLRPGDKLYPVVIEESVFLKDRETNTLIPLSNHDLLTVLKNAAFILPIDSFESSGVTGILSQYQGNDLGELVYNTVLNQVLLKIGNNYYKKWLSKNNQYGVSSILYYDNGALNKKRIYYTLGNEFILYKYSDSAGTLVPTSLSDTTNISQILERLESITNTGSRIVKVRALTEDRDLDPITQDDKDLAMANGEYIVEEYQIYGYNPNTLQWELNYNIDRTEGLFFIYDDALYRFGASRYEKVLEGASKGKVIKVIYMYTEDNFSYVHEGEYAIYQGVIYTRKNGNISEVTDLDWDSTIIYGIEGSLYKYSPQQRRLEEIVHINEYLSFCVTEEDLIEWGYVAAKNFAEDAHCFHNGFHLISTHHHISGSTNVVSHLRPIDYDTNFPIYWFYDTDNSNLYRYESETEEWLQVKNGNYLRLLFLEDNTIYRYHENTGLVPIAHIWDQTMADNFQKDLKNMHILVQLDAYNSNPNTQMSYDDLQDGAVIYDNGLYILHKEDLDDPESWSVDMISNIYGDKNPIFCIWNGCIYKYNQEDYSIQKIAPDLTGYATLQDLASKASLNSPNFTGTPTVPIQEAGDNSLAIANTAFVQNAIANAMLYDPNNAQSTPLFGDQSNIIAQLDYMWRTKNNFEVVDNIILNRQVRDNDTTTFDGKVVLQVMRGDPTIVNRCVYSGATAAGRWIVTEAQQTITYPGRTEDGNYYTHTGFYVLNKKDGRLYRWDSEEENFVEVYSWETAMKETFAKFYEERTSVYTIKGFVEFAHDLFDIEDPQAGDKYLVRYGDWFNGTGYEFRRMVYTRATNNTWVGVLTADITDPNTIFIGDNKIYKWDVGTQEYVVVLDLSTQILEAQSISANDQGFTRASLVHEKLAQIQSVYNRVLTDKANLNSPVFTGNPKAPTPDLASNDESIATTAFVKQLYDAVIQGLLEIKQTLYTILEQENE